MFSETLPTDSDLMQLFKNSIRKSLLIILKMCGEEKFVIIFTEDGTIIHLQRATQILCRFLLLGGNHTTILLLPPSICPAIQTRLKCKLDIWCCDVCDNTAAHPQPAHIHTCTSSRTLTRSFTWNTGLLGYKDKRVNEGFERWTEAKEIYLAHF